MNWYLIQTKPNAHVLASKHLNNQNLKVFLPMIKRTKKNTRKFVTSKVPLFAGYLFIGTASKTPPWSSINATRGVSKVVSSDGTYRPVDKNIIEGLMCRCDTQGVLKTKENISAGDKIKIEEGPFSNFICEVERIEHANRVWVLMRLMNQKIRAKVSLQSLSGSD